MGDVFWLGICIKYLFGLGTSNRSVFDMNIGLVAKGVNNLDGVSTMYLWRMRDYTYEIVNTAPPGATERLVETPYEVALKKFENMVDNMVLV